MYGTEIKTDKDLNARVIPNDNGIAADRLPWWGVSAAIFGVSVPKVDGMSLCLGLRPSLLTFGKVQACLALLSLNRRLIKFLLALFAAGTAPVVGQVFEGHAVVLSRVIDVATDGADVFSGGFFLFENNFRSAR